MRLLQARTEQDPRDGFVSVFLSGKRVLDLGLSGGLRCRGCHSNEPISGNPWSINSCDKDWRRGPCSTGVCPVFQLPSSLQLSGSSFKLRLQLQTCIESSFVAWSADFHGCFSCNREYGMGKKGCTGLKPLTAEPNRRVSLPVFALFGPTLPHVFLPSPSRQH